MEQCDIGQILSPLRKSSMPKSSQGEVPEVHYLLTDGPNTSAAIARQLELAGLTPGNARKRIERAAYPVERVADIQLPHRGQILYLSSHKEREDFVPRIIQLLSETKSSYGLALKSINARGGCVPVSLFNTVSGSPISLKKQIGVEAILGTLIRLELLRRATIPSLGEVIYTSGMNPNSPEIINYVKARLKAEQIMLCGIKDWLRKLGLVSYDKVEVRGDQDRKHFGQFEWDLTAPSYIYPLASLGKDSRMTNGFVVADVMMLGNAGADAVDYFVNKFEIMRSRRSTRPFMAFLVADRFEQEVFQVYKSKGIILTTVENIIGKDVAEALRGLVQVLSDAATAVRTEPERLDKMIEALTKIEGDAPNVRADLFEVAVGYSVKEDWATWVDLRQSITDPKSGEKAEIDVLGKNRERVQIIECKGNRAGHSLSKDEMEEWFKQKVPRIYNWLRVQGGHASSEHQVEFSVWTTGKFDGDALDFMSELKSQTRKYQVSWKDRQALKEHLKQKKLNNMNKLIDKHFSNNK